MDELWHAYWDSRSRETRDRLIVSYAPLVKWVAGRMASGLPGHLDERDLVADGVMGLIHAIEGYRVEVGAKFETYATPRIRGAILDALRKQDWVPRSTRSRERELRRAITELEAQLGRVPRDEEIAAKLGIPIEELNGLLAELSRLAMTSLDAPIVTGEEESTAGERVVDPHAKNPESQVLEADQSEAIAAGIAGLPEKEKIVLTLYYYENFTLREIGAVLGVTESRVSQLHAKALVRLRSHLEPGA
jgi:RNA polymerase sigma factor for flagellar operon FliA